MPPPPPPHAHQGVVETRRSKSAPRPTRSRAGATGDRREDHQPRLNARSKLNRGSFDEPAPTSNGKLCIHALRLLGWNSIDRSLLQTILCKRTAASYVAAYAESLVAEVSSSRSIVFFDWGCLCIIDEISPAYSNVDERHEEEAFEQYLDFLLKDVVYPCSSNEDVTVVQRPQDEDRDSITLIFDRGSTGRRNPILNDVVYLEPTVEAEDRRKRALACALALSQSLALKHVELELQRWITESVNPLTLVLAQSGDVPDEEDTLRLYGRLHGFLHEVDGIGQALAMPADIDVESKAIYLMAYEYLEVEARLKVMQERFDITKASLSLFKSLRESSESTRKERIIIYLLVVCVLIAGLELLVKASRWHG